MRKTILTLAALLVMTATMLAQYEREFPEYAVKNLKMGISSENQGVKKHSIFLAGRYEVSEVAKNLKKELSKEEDPSVRSLIALSLYKIEGYKIKKLAASYALNDPDQKVRNVCLSIYKLCEEETAPGSYAVR